MTIPRPEFPRPEFERSDWLNLNGRWQFQLDPDDVGESQGWFETDAPAFDNDIVVPFPWQSKLSDVKNDVYKGVAWYRRSFQLPEDWNERVSVNFGAVDYFAKVWVNGQLIGEHEGGYTPFRFDITEYLSEENVITVRVEDPADLREIPHGKQRSNPPNPWDDVSFTTTSGIWQTVWLESHPSNYITKIHVTPRVKEEQALFVVELNSTESQETLALSVEVTAPDGKKLANRLEVKPGTQKLSFGLSITDPILWDIGQGNLYNVTARLESPDGQTDEVKTYFGMRSIEIDGRNVLLNGRPIYLMSALDQGYWPDGLYTAPSDNALKADIEYAQGLGLNGLRKHIKIEDPRFLYWADKLGLLIWADTPSPVRFTQLARDRLVRDLERMIERDYNHPSIVIWSPYNESWGLEFRSHQEIQEYLSWLYDHIKTLDPTRLVVDNSGWRHVKTDIADSHKYTGDPSEWRGFMTLLAEDPMTIEVLNHPFYAGRHEYDGVPIMISEYGAGWRDDRSWDFKWQTDEIRRHAGVAGYTYTELYDIEHEFAGFALYDRTPKDFGFGPAMINSEDFVGIDYRKERQLTPGNELELGIYISAYGLPEFTTGTLKWRLEPVTPEISAPLLEGEFVIEVTPFTVTNFDLGFTVPDAFGPAKLWVEVYDDKNTLRAKNYFDFEILGEAPPIVEEKPEGNTLETILRMPLDSYTATSFKPEPNVKKLEDGPSSILTASGAGFLEYKLPLPKGDDWQELSVAAEVGSLPPEVAMALEGKGYPTDVTVSVNGVMLTQWNVPDRPVNALGALTRINKLGVGEHGFWMEATASGETLEQIRTRAMQDGFLLVRLETPEDAVPKRGLSLFGARGGRYGRDPVLTLKTLQP